MNPGPQDSPALALGHEAEDLQRRLQRLARGLVHDEAAAEDVVQEAWLAALKAPAHQVRDWGAWLTTVVRRIATKSRLRARRQRDSEGQGATPEMFTEDGLRERIETFRSLERAVADLADPYRAVMQLRFFEERSYPEICEILERPKETVRSQIKRGLEMLRRRLDSEHGGRRSSWAGLLLPLAGRAPSTSATRLGFALALLLTPGLLAFAWWRLGGGPADPGTGLAALDPPGEESESGGALSAEEPKESQPAERSAIEAPSPPATLTTEEAPSESPSREMAYIDVRVVDDLGHPSPNALVGYRSSTVGTRTSPPTDENGQVRLEIEPEAIGPVTHGVVGIELRAISQIHASTQMHMIPLSPGETYALDLPLRGPSHRIHFEVVDPGGAPIEGARIAFNVDPRMVERLEDGRVLDDPVYRAVTDREGRAFLERLHGGHFAIDVEAAGFAPAKQSVDLVEPDQSVRVQLERGTRVRGVVRDAIGEPVHRAEVWVSVPFGTEEVSTRSERDGSFLLEGVPAGPRMLHARTRRGLGASRSIDLGPGEELHWEARVEQLEPFVIRLETHGGEAPPRGTRVGLLAKVHGWDWGRVETTDVHGRVEFTQLPDAPLTLMAFTPEDAQVSATLAWVSGIRPSPEEFVVTLGERAAPYVPATVRGELRIPPSIPASVVWIEILADAEGPTLRSKLDPQSSSFVHTATPPGRSGVIVFCGDLGAQLLRVVVLAEGEDLDLGALRVESPREAPTLEGIEPTARGALLQDVGAVELKIIRPHCGPELGSLLPGKYRWVPSDGGEPVAFEVR